MIRTAIALIAVLSVGPAYVGAAETKEKAPARESKKRLEKGKGTSMTGCIDESGEKYVLAGEEEMNTKLVLRGRAFSDDNFARFVGQKATVTGEVKSEGDSRVMLVDRIESVSPTCH